MESRVSRTVHENRWRLFSFADRIAGVNLAASPEACAPDSRSMSEGGGDVQRPP